MPRVLQSVKRPEAALGDLGADLPGDLFANTARPPPADPARMGTEHPRKEIAGEQEPDEQRKWGRDRTDDRHVDAA